MSYEERVIIERMLERKESIRAIARMLGRSVSSISYELKHKSVASVYGAKKAQHKTYWKRYTSKQQCNIVALDRDLSVFVRDKLVLGWSPERMSGYLKRQNGAYASKKSIYKYIDHRCFEKYLFWKGRKKKKRVCIRSIWTDGRRNISQRPEIVSSGHFEADFIVSKHNSSSLLVATDKVSRYTEIKRIKNRKHATVMRAFQNIFNGKTVKSITLDNDISFRGWKQIETRLHTSVFFCNPYHSWEKGLVENTNRWIRKFIPKRSDISKISKTVIHDSMNYLNHIPRQCLNYRTAHEVFFNESDPCLKQKHHP